LSKPTTPLHEVSPMRLRYLALLIVLTLVAGWLRFTGTAFGLPGLFRPDEEYMLNPAMGFVNDWNPHFSIYPAAQMYVQHFALMVYARAHGEKDDFRDFYQGDSYPTAHLVARGASATLGAATVPAIYYAAAPVFGVPAGLAAAAIVTFSTMHVLNSKFATTDVGTVFWLTLAIAMIVRIANYGRWRDYILAGVFCGLATATKYPAGAIVFGVAAAHLGNCRRGRGLLRAMVDPRIYVAAILTFLAFFCGTPYTLLDWSQTLRDYGYQRTFVVNGYSAAGYGWRWLFLRTMPDCFGLAICVLLILGMLWALTGRRGSFSLLAFIAATFIALIRSHQLFYRYILIPFPAMVILAAILVADLFELAELQLGRKIGIAVIVVFLGLILTPSLVRDLQLDHLLQKTDTRILARQWMMSHVAPGSPIAEVDDTTMYGKPPLRDIYNVQAFTDPALLRKRNVLWVVSDSYPALFYSRGPLPGEAAELDSQATLVFDTDPLVDGGPQPVFDINDAFYAPLQHISGISRPGPRIRIWKLK
jgi:hypothetical protein